LRENIETSAMTGASKPSVKRRGMMMCGCVVSAVLVAACGSVAATSGPRTTLPAPAALADCKLPRLSAQPLDPDGALRGPAVAALHGGPARAGFSLDAGAFSMTPPAAGETPSVSAAQAECAALASASPNGMSMLELASLSGIAVGYGRVSIATALTPPSTFPYVARSGLNQNTNPRLPAPGSYQQRLAWLVVVKNWLMHSSPPIAAGEPVPTTTATPQYFEYLIFVVDARTGSDALFYDEARSGPSATAVSVPTEKFSVPWTLLSRSPDGYSGQVRATVQSCDGLPNPVWIDNGRTSLRVVVERPVGPACGAQEQVTLPLNAAALTADLPDDITHDPLGPVLTLPSSQPPKPPNCTTTPSHGGPPQVSCPYDGPGATSGIFRLLDEFDNKATIHIPVDSVLAVDPLYEGKRLAALPVRSSDPAELGPLDNFIDNEINEFRAWRAGHADLFVPTPGCTTITAPKCASPWVVHVVIG
jgi:hypothetical protein